VIAALLVVPVLKGGGTLARQAAALVSAVVFPVLAMTWQLDRWRKKAPHRGGSLLRILSDGVGALTVTVLLSLIGGFYVGDVRFLLEMEIYRGVKLTFVAPLLLISLPYLARFNLFEESGEPGGLWRQVVKMLDYPVCLKTLIFFALGAVVAWVYVGRSGHTAGVPVPAAELKLRAFLENAMYARPREKEFMIAHPAFMLSVMALYRRWPRVLHFIL
ncbi:MAG: DUF5693 family protein, partial [Negativicutes bacterium]|nr:DUF5693 family protein [Negativicutes bacterium]